MPEQPPLIAHVVYRFDTGGLENGLANLIDEMPADLFRHSVISLTTVTDFAQRVRRPDVTFHALHKPPGQGLRLYPALYRLFRALQPAIVHTRNLAPLEAVVPAWAAGVPVRIHGEHGWDVADPDGRSAKFRWIRRLYRPFVTHYVALSMHLERYLVDTIGIPGARVTRICNGVDLSRFPSRGGRRGTIPDCPFTDERLWLVGTVGRMQAVKNQTDLARAFAGALRREPQLRATLRLVLVGDGPLRERCREILGTEGLLDLAWLPGERADIPALLRGLDCFVLPSLAEGISNTILEAMASGLPVVATRVGGNPELVEDGRTGRLVAAGDPDALAEAIVALATRPDRARELGVAGRNRVESRFGLPAMTAAYAQLYTSLLAGHGTGRASASAGATGH